MTAFSDELVQQFRRVAIERLDRIEQAWAAVTAKLDTGAATTLHRELHTLKGESRLLGFSDVNLVCHKLEDLMEVARARGYVIDEDFDLSVNMAIRFMAMLVRKKVGSQLVGIDLAGFVVRIDGILAEHRASPGTPQRLTTGAMVPLKSAPTAPRVPRVLRGRLGPIAVDAFLEYAVARGARRDRLRGSWHALRDMIGVQRAVLGPGELTKHAAGGQALATELGKQVAIEFELATVEATTEISTAVDAAALHLVRNAVDHGIESPAERVAAGKPPAGTIRVRAAESGGAYVMTVEDDGRGVVLDEVRRRAIERGLLAGDVTIDDRWLELVCQPGFTTRTAASEVSGRGVGLDVVRTGIHELGGTLSATTGAGRGTAWKLSVPLPRVTIPAWVFRIPNAPFPVAIDAAWSPLPEPVAVAPVFDLACRLGLADVPATTAICYFQRGALVIGIATDSAPLSTEVRRLVAAPAPALGDVIVTEASEGLLVYPDRTL